MPICNFANSAGKWCFADLALRSETMILSMLVSLNKRGSSVWICRNLVISFFKTELTHIFVLLNSDKNNPLKDVARLRTTQACPFVKCHWNEIYICSSNCPWILCTVPAQHNMIGNCFLIAWMFFLYYTLSYQQSSQHLKS